MGDPIVVNIYTKKSTKTIRSGKEKENKTKLEAQRG
jgi:hypothetical protein